MSLRFDPLEITVAAQKNRQLRVRADTTGWPRVDAALFRDPARRADATVTLSRDDLEALLHALETVHDALDDRRERWLASDDGRAWRERQREPMQPAGA